jgi:isopenicillin N synthase-like dioxygenase
MSTIPSLDLSDFLSDNGSKKNEFVEAIGEAFMEIGFVSLSGHFLDEKLSEELYTQVRAFFGLPAGEKKKYEIDGIAGQRGYTSFGREHAKDHYKSDLKEFWHFGQQLPAGSFYEDKYPENIKVAELPHFNTIGNNVFMLLEKTGIYVLRAIALYLGIDENYFDPYVKEGNSILRAIHYPPITTDPKGALRAAEHTDINLITLLMGARGDGLQVQNHHGDWIEVRAGHDELIINVGDMLSRYTNNRLVSTVHRVVNPPKELWGTARYSVPFFMHPVSDMKLDCLESCIDSENPKGYDDITAGEFLEQRLREIGLS